MTPDFSGKLKMSQSEDTASSLCDGAEFFFIIDVKKKSSQIDVGVYENAFAGLGSKIGRHRLSKSEF
jgi:hypothetical protein